MLRFSVTFVITLLNLFVLYVLLKRILWDRLAAFMDERSSKVRRELEEAGAAKRRAEELKDRYEALLANAENEAEWVVRDAEDRGREEYRRIIAEAEAEAAAIRRRAEEQAIRERDRARDELVAEIAALAIAAASEVTRRRLGGADDVAEAEAFLRSAETGRGR